MLEVDLARLFLKEVLRGNISFQPHLGIVISSEHYVSLCTICLGLRIHIYIYTYILYPWCFLLPQTLQKEHLIFECIWWFWFLWIEAEEWSNIFVNISIREMPNLFLGNMSQHDQTSSKATPVKWPMSGWCKQWGDFCSDVVADGRETRTCFCDVEVLEMFASFVQNVD